MPDDLFDSVKIPRERVAVLIGKEGKTKGKIERLTGVKISVDSGSGEVEIEGKEAGAMNFYSTVNIVRAVGRGFSPENAMLLLDEGMLLDVIKVSDIAGGSERAMAVKKGRVIGRQGAARERIEQATDCKIAVQGKTIGIIGSNEGVEVARKAVEMLLQGAEHKKIFRFLERRKLAGEKFSI